MSESVILAAVGTPLADVVIGEAGRIARELDGTLHLVAAYRPASTGERQRAHRRLPAGLSLDYDDDRLIEARDALEDAREAVPTDLAVRLHLERGDLLAGLCRVAQREEALLIVAATPTGRASRRAGARPPCQARSLPGASHRGPRQRSGPAPIGASRSAPHPRCAD